MDKNERREAYLAKLRDPRWQKKRLEILSRDNWTCQICSDTTTTLHVHHRAYMRGKEPWDHLDELLVTLCERCHEEETWWGQAAAEELLFQLRRKGLFDKQIYSIAAGMVFAPEWKDRARLASAIEWLFSDTDAQSGLIAAYLAANQKGEE